jgi:N6-L-threonylcarbamoyladenine synthase
MYLLAFESSCDDTSVALLRNEELISMHTYTQVEHIATMGVVPEIAARLHADHIFDLITLVLTEGNIQLSDINFFAATSEPWLVPSLLIGKTVAKTLALSHKKPIFWINHIEGHIFSLLLDRKIEELKFPLVVLSASGGHNDLFLWKSLYEIEKIGGTVDDSAGESMDKVGRSLWLPFPAGRLIDELAQKYNPEVHTNIPTFPLVFPEETLNFSFSGLKSAALREIELRKKDHTELTEIDHIEISYGYQKIITTILSKRLVEAQKKTGAKSLALVGWVSANSTLRKILEEYSAENKIPYYTPKSLKYCGDNAAMIGIRAHWESKKDS